MGDAPKSIEKEIKNKDIDVLKVAHHGSKYSSEENFLKQVNPKYSIIFVDNKVSPKHPNKDVLELLNQMSKVYRTDVHGTIWMKSDGETIKVEERKDINLDGNGRKIGWLKDIILYHLYFQKYDKYYLLDIA